MSGLAVRSRDSNFSAFMCTVSYNCSSGVQGVYNWCTDGVEGVQLTWGSQGWGWAPGAESSARTQPWGGTAA